MTGALSRKGKNVVGAPSGGRQSVDANVPNMKGKGAFSTPSMKDKNANLPKGEKKQENLNLSQLYQRETWGLGKGLTHGSRVQDFNVIEFPTSMKLDECYR